MTACEANFDSLVGPSHNYAGLSFGNVASMAHKSELSNPREAALQGLVKMKALMDLGVPQGVLAPHERPDISTLRRLGFSGTDNEVLQRALHRSPEIFSACSSASSMWAANAATVSPSPDTADKRVHLTPANLFTQLHRSIEPTTTARILKAVFPDDSVFVHHPPLPPSATLGDEGAANHTRLCEPFSEQGVEFFVFGRVAFEAPGNGGLRPKPLHFPARQTFEASQSVARLHQLNFDHCVFAQQNPVAIDKGAFHNDVVAVGHQNVLFYHEQAFLESDKVVAELREKFERITQKPLILLKVSESELPLCDAIKSYLFNSQMITRRDGSMILVAPMECQELQSVRTYIETMLEDTYSSLSDIRYFDLRQSMRNGGGPACLRLRVVLLENELRAVNQNALLTESKLEVLVDWVKRHYRDRLILSDLADPNFLLESRTALDELTQILDLGSVYSFQT